MYWVKQCTSPIQKIPLEDIPFGQLVSEVLNQYWEFTISTDRECWLLHILYWGGPKSKESRNRLNEYFRVSDSAFSLCLDFWPIFSPFLFRSDTRYIISRWWRWSFFLFHIYVSLPCSDNILWYCDQILFRSDVSLSFLVCIVCRQEYKFQRGPRWGIKNSPTMIMLEIEAQKMWWSWLKWNCRKGDDHGWNRSPESIWIHSILCCPCHVV